MTSTMSLPKFEMLCRTVETEVNHTWMHWTGCKPLWLQVYT